MKSKDQTLRKRRELRVTEKENQEIEFFSDKLKISKNQFVRDSVNYYINHLKQQDDNGKYTDEAINKYEREIENLTQEKERMINHNKNLDKDISNHQRNQDIINQHIIPVAETIQNNKGYLKNSDIKNFLEIGKEKDSNFNLIGNELKDILKEQGFNYKE